MTPTAMNPAIRRQMGARQWLLLLILGVIWGGSFFFNALALKGLPPLSIVALRVAGGTTFLWAALLVLGFRPRRGLRQWRDLMVLAVINNIVPFTLIIWGQRDIASGVAAIINATVPFFTIIVAHLFTRDEPLATNQLAGVAVALGGIAYMIGLDAISGLGRNVISEFTVLGRRCATALPACGGGDSPTIRRSSHRRRRRSSPRPSCCRSLCLSMARQRSHRQAGQACSLPFSASACCAPPSPMCCFLRSCAAPAPAMSVW